MDGQENEFRAARTILQECLKLDVDSHYFIFTDETTHQVAEILAEAGIDLHLKPTMLYYPTTIQRKLQDRPLPTTITNSLTDVSAALICLDASQQTFAFRDNVRQTMWNANMKVAHMPGIDTNTLLLADVDYKQLMEQCRLFALAFAKGSQLEIITHDQSGTKHRLYVPLDAWNRFPIISDGIIEKGVWGNVPSGETYIAPPEGLAEGDIVINGSIHQFLLPHGEEMLLHFEQGQLVDWEPRNSAAGQYIQEAVVDFSLERGDTNWAYLAEVGLGANPNIANLAGNPLLNEKKYGSVHIALGDNMDMGGKIASTMHYDIVCLDAEVYIDGKPIIAGNQIVLREADWREDYKAVQVSESWSPELQIRCTAVNAVIDSQGHLIRYWDTSTGRTCSVPVGNDKTSVQLGNIYQYLVKNGYHSIQTLAEQYHGLSFDDFLRGTYLLSLYGLVSAQNRK